MTPTLRAGPTMLHQLDRAALRIAGNTITPPTEAAGAPFKAGDLRVVRQ